MSPLAWWGCFGFVVGTVLGALVLRLVLNNGVKSIIDILRRTLP